MIEIAIDIVEVRTDMVSTIIDMVEIEIDSPAGKALTCVSRLSADDEVCCDTSPAGDIMLEVSSLIASGIASRIVLHNPLVHD